ncbi:MAG TPA: ATP-dependent metallopeptidase FtsH/Yme1/Tma family protein, partial [Tepidisphaeraceae bacterium]|nr:ATP-dependent metallopeptidase FtsH/Yme1/Tma family protein [Tepidisphaeraceae bacterium]
MAEQRPDRQPRKTVRPPSGPGGMKFGRGIFGWVLFIGLAIMLFVLLKNQQVGTMDMSWSDLKEKLANSSIKSLKIESDQISGEFNTPQASGGMTYTKFATPVQQNMVDFNMLQWVTDHRGIADVKISNSQNLILQVVLPFVPWLLIFGFVWFFIFRQLRNSAGAGGMLGNFGRSKHKITSKEHTNVTFDDVAGIEEAKEEVM